MQAPNFNGPSTVSQVALFLSYKGFFLVPKTMYLRALLYLLQHYPITIVLHLSANLYILSNINTDYLLWQLQLNVAV